MQLNFVVNEKSYRLDVDLEFHTITLYQIFESEDDKEEFTYTVGQEA